MPVSMKHRSIVMIVFGVLALATPARADIEACASAAEDAERKSKRSGSSRRAAVSPRASTRPAHGCSARAAIRCSRTSINPSPSIVVTLSEGGREGVATRIVIDGAPSAAAVSGKAVDLDPGPHTIEAWHGNKSARTEVVLHAGDKRRSMNLAFPAPAPVGPSPSFLQRKLRARELHVGWVPRSSASPASRSCRSATSASSRRTTSMI